MASRQYLWGNPEIEKFNQLNPGVCRVDIGVREERYDKSFCLMFVFHHCAARFLNV